jgi:hypothetical protein
MKKRDLILLLFFGLILIDVLTDILWFRGDKSGSKIIENVYKTILVSSVLWFVGIDRNKIIGLIILYWSMHLYFFDPAFNLMARLDINYVGTTSGIYDVVLKKLGNYWTWIIKSVVLFIGVFIYLNSLRK